MSRTRSELYYHIIFTTNDRRRFLAADIRPELYRYIAGIVRNLGGQLIAIGGVEDHCHMLPKLPPTIDLSSLLQHVKGSSSLWLKRRYPFLADFQWQEGYAAFSVSPAAVAGVRRYVLRQVQHHRQSTLERELQDLETACQGLGIPSDGVLEK